jgi:hypothetical protein
MQASKSTCSPRMLMRATLACHAYAMQSTTAFCNRCATPCAQVATVMHKLDDAISLLKCAAAPTRTAACAAHGCTWRVGLIAICFACVIAHACTSSPAAHAAPRAIPPLPLQEGPGRGRPQRPRRRLGDLRRRRPQLRPVDRLAQARQRVRHQGRLREEVRKLSNPVRTMHSAALPAGFTPWDAIVAAALASTTPPQPPRLRLSRPLTRAPLPCLARVLSSAYPRPPRAARWPTTSSRRS